MPEEEERPTVVCLRVSETTIPTPGATQQSCSTCGEPVWLSSATRKSLPDARALCNECALDEMLALPNGTTVEIAMTKECLAEARANLINHKRRN